VIREREETDRVYTFLGALDSSYGVIRAQILLLIDKLSFEEVITRIRQEVTRRVALGTFDQIPKSEAHAFSVHHFNARKVRGKGEIERCAHCKKSSHSQDRCWVLNPHLRPKRGDQQLTEAPKRRGMKTLEIERMGFLSTKEIEDESNTSQEESRLDKIEVFMVSLINQQTQQQLGSCLGSISTNSFNTNLNCDKLSPNYDVLIKNKIRVEIKPNK
jgi:hypothetical protein